MNDLHPHWRSTSPAVTEAAPSRGVKIPIGGRTISRSPAAVTGILLVLVLGFAVFDGLSSLDITGENTLAQNRNGPWNSHHQGRRHAADGHRATRTRDRLDQSGRYPPHSGIGNHRRGEWRHPLHARRLPPRPAEFPPGAQSPQRQTHVHIDDIREDIRRDQYRRSGADASFRDARSGTAWNSIRK